jgi:hypothetical protein
LCLLVPSEILRRLRSRGRYLNTSNVWITANPQSLAIGQINGKGKNVKVIVEVVASPELTMGQHPTNEAGPFPAITHTPRDPAIHVTTLGTVTYDEAQKKCAMKVVGRKFRYPLGRIVVTDVKIYGSENDAVVAVCLRRPFRGTIYLSGKPVYDPDSNDLSVPDLDYTLATRDVLINTADWILHTTFQHDLASACRFNASSTLSDLKKKYGKLSFKLGKIAIVNTSLGDVKPLGIFLDREAFNIVVTLNGQADVQIEVGRLVNGGSL